MGIDLKSREKSAQKVKMGLKLTSVELDATTTSEIIPLYTVAEKVSFQADGDLAGTVEFSVDGVNFKNSTAIAGSNGIASFNTHNVAALKVTRSSGSGKLHIAVK